MPNPGSQREDKKTQLTANFSSNVCHDIYIYINIYFLFLNHMTAVLQSHWLLCQPPHTTGCRAARYLQSAAPSVVRAEIERDTLPADFVCLTL